MTYCKQTCLFTTRVGDFISPLPPVVDMDSPGQAVVEQMRQEGAVRSLVRGPDGHLIGVFSASDLLRWTPCQGEPALPVGQLMTPIARPAAVDLPLFRAVTLMRQQSLEALPVVDAQGRPLGVLVLSSLLEPLLGGQLSLAAVIAQDQTPADLHRARQAQFELAAVLLEQHAPPPDILAVLSRLNDEIYRCILAQAMAEMAAQGWGQPPVPFAVVVTGSGGRCESLLGPDQDNGFILQDYPDALCESVNDYFYELAARMTQRLDAVGIRLCSGYMMATNPSWRKRLSEWQAQLLGWLRKPSLASTTLLAIWVDFRCVSGDYRLAEVLRDFATNHIPQHYGFLRELELLQREHDVAVTPLRTFKCERQPDQGGRRKVDIKRKGLLPLMEGVRILALRDGIRALETMVRLTALQERGTLKAELADAVQDAYIFMTGLLLRQQLQDHSAGRHPGAYVAPEALSRRDRQRLNESLRTVIRLRGMVHMEFTGELF